MFVSNNVRIKGGLLLGGLLCLTLATPAPVHASPVVTVTEKVQQLEEAVKKADRTAILNLLADAPDNRGREELLAFLDDYEATGNLEYMMQEYFRGQVKTEWLLADHSIAVGDVKFDSDGNTLTGARLMLVVGLRQPDGSVLTRDVPAYMNLGDRRLVLPEGVLPFDAKRSQLLTDLLRYRAHLMSATMGQVIQGKLKSRDEVAQAISEDLKNAEPMQRFLAGTLTLDALQAAADALSKAVAGAFNNALGRAFADAARKAWAK